MSIDANEGRDVYSQLDPDDRDSLLRYPQRLRREMYKHASVELKVRESGLKAKGGNARKMKDKVKSDASDAGVHIKPRFTLGKKNKGMSGGAGGKSTGAQQ